jgi:hypothetical protein
MRGESRYGSLQLSVVSMIMRSDHGKCSNRLLKFVVACCLATIVKESACTRLVVGVCGLQATIVAVGLSIGLPPS